MQPQDFTIAGVITSSNTIDDTITVSPAIAGRKVVTCSSVVPGNKHAPNAWEYLIHEQTGPKGTWESTGVKRFQDDAPVWYKYVNQGSSWSQWYGRMPYPGAELERVLYNKALTKLYDQIRSSDVNLAVTIGEMPETFKMIKAVVDGAVSAKKSLKRLIKDNGIAGASRKLSSGWLGYAYGIRPLVGDLQAMLNHVTSTPSFLDVTTKARASGSRTSTDRQDGVTTTVTDSRRCQIGVTWAPNDYKMSELTRITSIFPPTLLWELTTLSFVVDWFVDVGSYLANLEASFGVGLTFKHGYVTHSRLVELQQSCAWSVSPTVETHRYLRPTLAIWQCSATEKALKRSLLSGFPRPMLPSLNVSLGSEQLLSLAALLRTIGLKKY